MTVPSTTNRVDYVGTGLVTVYPYTFRIFANSDLLVIRTDDAGNQTTLVLNTDYTVSNAGSYSGGNVTLTTALPSGYTLSIKRVLPLTQLVDLKNQGQFYAETHETVFDRLTMLVQQQTDSGAGVVRHNAVDAGVVDAELPSRVAGAVPQLNGTGDGWQWLSLQSAGLAAAGNQTVDQFTAGAGFTAGTTTALTLSRNPGNKNATFVTFDGVLQHKSTYSVSGTTLTFTSAIPVGVGQVEVMIFNTLAVGVPPDGSDASTYYAKATGSTLSRTLAARYAEIANALDFGADNTGETATHTQIQAAIDSITTGIVKLPRGTYKITAALVLKTGVSLVGDGSGSTIINNTGTTDSITVGDGVSDVRSCCVVGLKILGNASSGRAFYGRKFGNQCVLSDVFAENGSVGFRFDSCYTSEISNCRVYLTVGDGIQLVNGCHNAVVRRNMITGCGGHGVFIDGSYTAIVRDNDIEFCGKDQVHIQGASRGGSVVDNYIEGIQPTASGYAGIQVDACDSLVIRGNFFDATQTGTFGTNGTGTYIKATAGVRILADENGFASIAGTQTHVNFLVGCSNCRAKVPLGSTFTNASSSCRVMHDDHDERGVSAYQNAAQTFTQSAWNTVTWDTEVFDSKGELASNLFAPKDYGVYAISVSVGVNSIAANKGVWVRLYNVTDTFEIAQSRIYAPNAATSIIPSVSFVEFLSQGKSYRIELFLDDTVNRTAISGSPYTRLSIRRIS